MKRVLAAAVLTLCCAACGGGGASSSQPTPAPTLVEHPKTGILVPAANARDMVNQLNHQQNGYEQQTGGTNP